MGTEHWIAELIAIPIKPNFFQEYTKSKVHVLQAAPR